MIDCDNDYIKDEIVEEIKFKPGNCSRCNYTNLTVMNNKILCKDGNNWSWLEDAKYSCWNKYIK